MTQYIYLLDMDTLTEALTVFTVRQSLALETGRLIQTDKSKDLEGQEHQTTPILL